MSWSVKNGWHEAVGQFTRKADAQELARQMRAANRQAGIDAGPVRVITTYEARGGKRKNPTKAQKKEKTRKASAKRRVATALAGWLKKMNPGTKIVGAKVQKLAGGVLKVTPIKANRARGRKR